LEGTAVAGGRTGHRRHALVRAQVRTLLALPRGRGRRRGASDDLRALHEQPLRRRRSAHGGLMAAAARARLLPWFAVALAVIALDQITKTLILGHFQFGDSRYVTSFFNLVRVHNTGAAFSFLAGASGWQRWFFV